MTTLIAILFGLGIGVFQTRRYYKQKIQVLKKDISMLEHCLRTEQAYTVSTNQSDEDYEWDSNASCTP
jgi:hypothetical protein